jgi:hypothetical protein
MSFPAVAQAVPLDRPVYRRDGRVKWGRLIVASIFSMGISAVMALALSRIFLAGWYVTILVPIAMGFPVAAATYLVIKFSHCRNMMLAILVGLLTGLVYYPGWYHAHLVSLAGQHAALRLDLLPSFIWFRLQNDAAGEVGRPLQAPSVITNSVFFGVELFVVLCMSVGAAAYRVTRAYCHHCGEWTRTASHMGPPGSADLVHRLLVEDQLQQLPEIPKVPTQAQDPTSTITVEACRLVGTNLSCCAFLTLLENPGTRNKTARSIRKVLNQTAITRDELGYLSARILGLVALAPPGFIPEEAMAIADEPTGTSDQNRHLKPFEHVAHVETASPTDRDSIYSARSATVLAAMSFIPVVSFIAGCGLLFLTWKFWPGALSVACLISGLVAVVFGAVVCFVNVDYFNYRQHFCWVCDLIAARRDAIVRPSDPQAFFVSIMPRQFWTNQVTNFPSDGGFLTIDTSSRELLFEGLKERYRIPGKAILSCEVTNTTPGTGRFYL